MNILIKSGSKNGFVYATISVLILITGLIMGLAMTSCRKLKDADGVYVAPYANLRAFCFYYNNAKKNVVFKFFDGNSFVNYIGLKSNILKKDGIQTLEVTFIQGASGRQSKEFMTIEDGWTAVTIPLKKFDPKTWRVIYKDEIGVHEVKYNGLLAEPLTPCHLPITPNVSGDPFQDQEHSEEQGSPLK